MLNKILKPLASLRLTVVCLVLALVLVFGGTIAQVHLGLYEVQSRYFRSLFVLWALPSGTEIPIFPGGWLIGGVLLVNLIAGHLTRFQFTRKKLGIWLAHLGLIFLLAGQFVTEAWQQESLMRIDTGETKNYSEDSRKNELAIIDTTNPDRDEVVALSGDVLTSEKEIRRSQFPFTIKVKAFLPNSTPTRLGDSPVGTIKATHGIGQRLLFAPTATTATMDSENVPAAWLEIVGDKGAIGSWAVSTWLTKRQYITRLNEWLGDSTDVGAPQEFEYNGHTYRIELRAMRYYKPYSLTLKEFRHDLYQGTSIAKNFSSLVHLEDPERGENRDVVIRMNNPLRYRGETYYQSSFEPGDRVTILQDVRNPASATPYVACSLITIGLLVQFLMHLLGFGHKLATRNNTVEPARPASASTRKETR